MPFNLPGLIFPPSNFKIKEEKEKLFILDPSRKKYVLLTPEEWVRQNCLHYLRDHKGFPISYLAVERSFNLNNQILRYDIVAYSKEAKPLLLVECKAPEVKISQKTFDQVAVYNLKLKVPYLILTNGLELYCCVADFQNSKYIFLKEIPDFKTISL